jgi:uncharacterized RDD family membrane protein YckC
VDATFNVTVALGVFLLLSLATGRPLPAPGAEGEPPPWNPLAFAASLVPLALQWMLIARTGQSVGKRYLGMSIVRADGQRPGWVQSVLLRHGVFTALTVMPTLLGAAQVPVSVLQPLTLLVGAFSVANVLRILQPSRRCLHDLLAGTYVAG